MRKILTIGSVVLLVSLSACYPTAGSRSTVGTYTPVYDTNSGDTIWLNEACCGSERRRAPLMNYDTGEMYFPIGDRGTYQDDDGNLYQAY